MNEKEKAENCYRQMYRGMVEKDSGILSEVLDDTFVLVHMTGMRQSKAEFIRAVKDGTLNYYSADHRSVNAAVFGGGRYTWRLQLKLKLIKKPDAWKITEAIASTF